MRAHALVVRNTVCASAMPLNRRAARIGWREHLQQDITRAVRFAAAYSPLHVKECSKFE